MSGFIGLVELGSMTGSQFAAGKSYHDTDMSPCIAGMMNGASFEDFVAEAETSSVDAPPFVAVSGASLIIVRSF